MFFSFKEVASTRMPSTPYTGENGERLQRIQLLWAADHTGSFLGLDLFERQRPPDLQRAVQAAGDEGIAVLGEGEAQNPSGVPSQNSRFLVKLRVVTLTSNPPSSRQPGHSGSAPTPVSSAPRFPQMRLRVIGCFTAQVSDSWLAPRLRLLFLLRDFCPRRGTPDLGLVIPVDRNDQVSVR